MHRRRWVHPLEFHYRAQGVKMSNELQNREWSTWITVSKTVKPRLNRLNSYREMAARTWLLNWHVFVICCRSEVDGDVISGHHVTVTLTVFEISKQNHFVTTAAEPVEADIDDSIKRKRIRVSFNKFHKINHFIWGDCTFLDEIKNMKYT